MNLSDFALLKNEPDHYVVGHPKGKSLKVPKSGLSDKAHKLISRLKQHQNFQEGGDVEGAQTEEAPQEETETIPVSLNPQLSGPYAPIAPAEETPAELTQPKTVAEAEAMNIPVATSPEETVPGQIPRGLPGGLAAGAAPNTQAALGEAEASVKEALKTEQTAGKEAAQGYQQAVTAIAKEPSADELWQKYKAADDKYRQLLESNTIDPQRYFHNMDTGSKIASGLGLILGGIGSAITRGPNLAAAQINSAIQNDIEAQRNDQSKTMNLWKMNREAYGTEAAADLATRNQFLTIAEVKAKQAMATVPSAQAQARLAPVILGMEQQKQMNQWMLSRLTGTASGTELQHQNELQVMQQLRPDLYKDMEAKYIPGVGTAKVPVSPKDRTELVTYKNLDDRLDEAIHFQSVNAGAIGTIPGTPANAKAQNIRSSLEVELNKLYALNRLTEIEYNNFKSQIPDVGSFWTQNSLARLHDLKGQLENKQTNLMNGLGVQPFAQAPSDQKALAWARLNPTDPRAFAIAQKLGVR